MRVGAVILAAGASKRLGKPKQLLILGGETLLERAVRVARAAGCSPVVVVLGASAEAVEAGCELDDAVVVVNESWAEGMGSSLRAGVGALGDVDGCIAMACDMPAVTAGHLRALMSWGEATASFYSGKRGVPAYFPVESFPSLLELRGDSGAKELLRGARFVELAGGELDVDTTEDVARAHARFG